MSYAELFQIIDFSAYALEVAAEKIVILYLAEFVRKIFGNSAPVGPEFLSRSVSKALCPRKPVGKNLIHHPARKAAKLFFVVFITEDLKVVQSALFSESVFVFSYSFSVGVKAVKI